MSGAEELRERIAAARDTNPALARRLTDELIAAATGRHVNPPRPAQAPTPPPAQRPTTRRARRPRTGRCPDCHGPAGRYRDGLCHTCHNWRADGRVRTPADRDQRYPDRFCSNCTRQMRTHEMRRHGRCGACARYLSRNGRERPRHLYEARR